MSSRIALGTHSLHRLMTSGARRELLSLAWELGIRRFDTAPSYGSGLAEAELGRFSRGRRDGLVLTTKFGIPTHRLGLLPGWNQLAAVARQMRRAAGNASRVREPARRYDAAELRISVERSLRALQTDYIDVLYLHEPQMNSLSDADELLVALGSLKDAGKIRSIGLSGQAASCAHIAARWPALAGVQQLQICADVRGLPIAPQPDAQRPQVLFWEFPAGRTGPAAWLEETLQRLSMIAAKSVTLVSTNSPAVLRETMAQLGGHIDAAITATPSIV